MGVYNATTQMWNFSVRFCYTYHYLYVYINVVQIVSSINVELICLTITVPYVNKIEVSRWSKSTCWSTQSKTYLGDQDELLGAVYCQALCWEGSCCCTKKRKRITTFECEADPIERSYGHEVHETERGR